MKTIRKIKVSVSGLKLSPCIDDTDARLENEDAPADRVASRLADLVDWSKATALEKIGEGEQGLRIVRAWLRPKLDPAAAL